MSDDQSPRPLAGAKVLVVDDDEDTRDLYAMALERAGAEVRAASNASEAFRVVLKWPPTIVVSDLAMPGLDGSALLREIRSLHRLREIPAIAVSGSVDPRDREGARAAGFQEVVAKPLTPQSLIAILVRWATAAV